MADSGKLHSIYAALDSNNYVRALKLTQHKSVCSWKITLALKSHALERLGRKDESVLVIKHELLSYIQLKSAADGKDELLEYLVRLRRQKEGNRDALKCVSVADHNSNNGMDDVLKIFDNPLTKVYHEAVDGSNGKDVISDETTLATIAVTLRALRLNQTMVHMYTLASSFNPTVYRSLYFSTLRLLTDPLFSQLPSNSLLALELMQSSTMIMARSDKKFFSWTAITALWRLQNIKQCGAGSSGSGTEARMETLLPRLAEGLAKRVIADTNTATVYDWRVYIQTMVVQNKHREAMEELLNYNPPTVQVDDCVEEGVPAFMTSKARIELLAKLAEENGEYDRALQWNEQLLCESADDWTYGIALLNCANNMHHEQGNEKCDAILDDIKNRLDGGKALRGPHLLDIEMISFQIRSDESNKIVYVKKLQQTIMLYVETFGGSSSCCFTDIRTYLTLLLDETQDKDKVIQELMQWCRLMRNSNQLQCDELDSHYEVNPPLDWRNKLRKYVIACQIGLEAWSKAKDKIDSDSYVDMLPDVNTMMQVWEQSLSMYKAHSGDENQKEVLPGDDLILLSAFTLLYRSKSPHDPNLLIYIISLLEHGLDHSPHNPQLILFLLALYASPLILNASSRTFDLFQLLDVKQIQLDSLSYLLLPSAVSSGLYTEATEHCSQILGMHRSSAGDVPEYARKSMENGFYQVAEDMISFQRFKMQNSLQLLEAKGLIMDLAPFIFYGDKEKLCLGTVHGLVGGADDEKRAVKMVDDACDYFGAPSILKVVKDNTELSSSQPPSIFEDNRDFSVWNFIIGDEKKQRNFASWKSYDKIVTESCRRGHVHGILVRAVLVVSLAKPPKKKKKKGNNSVTLMVSEAMRGRCKSLTDAVNDGNKILSTELNNSWAAMKGICAVITSLCGNDPPIMAADTEEDDDSTVCLLKNAQAQIAVMREQSSSIYFTALTHNDATSRTATLLCNACHLLPSQIIPLFTLMEVVRKLFVIQGRRKKRFKESKALLCLGTELKEMIDDLIESLTSAQQTQDILVTSATGYPALNMHIANTEFFTSAKGEQKIKEVIKNLLSSHEQSRESVIPILKHIINVLENYDNDQGN